MAEFHHGSFEKFGGWFCISLEKKIILEFLIAELRERGNNLDFFFFNHLGFGCSTQYIVFYVESRNGSVVSTMGII